MLNKLFHVIEMGMEMALNTPSIINYQLLLLQKLQSNIIISASHLVR